GASHSKKQRRRVRLTAAAARRRPGRLAWLQQGQGNPQRGRCRLQGPADGAASPPGSSGGRRCSRGQRGASKGAGRSPRRGRRGRSRGESEGPVAIRRQRIESLFPKEVPAT